MSSSNLSTSTRGAVVLACVLGACSACHVDVVDEIDARMERDAWWETCPSSFLTTSCNPTAPPGMQGCLTGQKCTWINVTDVPAPCGKLGCVPDGRVDLAGACTRGPSGETTGFDDCRAGLICIENVCRDICGFDGSASAACESGYNCTRYADTFANGDDFPLTGACIAGCDPLTQMKSSSNPPEGCGEGMGCYLVTGQTETTAVCASTGALMHDQDIVGTAYANSCVPGAQPRRKDALTQDLECGGLCRMVDVRMGVNEASEGGEVTSSTTDIDSCQATWGAPSPSDALEGESCRYWRGREPFDALSPYSNTVGWCFEHATYLYDSDRDMTPDRLFPRCTALTTGDIEPPIDNPPHNDALYFWCHEAPPPMLAITLRSIRALHVGEASKLDRLIDRSRDRAERQRASGSGQTISAHR